MSEALDNVFVGSQARPLRRPASKGGEPMPAGANARRPSSQRGLLIMGGGDSGAGDPAGAGARFDLDFSECMALSWPGNAGLEQLLLAADLCGNQAPATSARMASRSESGPQAP